MSNNSSSFKPLNEKIYTKRNVDEQLGYSTELGPLTYRIAAHELAPEIIEKYYFPEMDLLKNLDLLEEGLRVSSALALVLAGEPWLISEDDWETFAISVEGWIEDTTRAPGTLASGRA